MISYSSRQEAQREANTRNRHPRGRQWASVTEHPAGGFVVVMQDHPAVEARQQADLKPATSVAKRVHATERARSHSDAFPAFTTTQGGHAAPNAQRAALQGLQRHVEMLTVWHQKLVTLLTIAGATSDLPDSVATDSESCDMPFADLNSHEPSADLLTKLQQQNLRLKQQNAQLMAAAVRATGLTETTIRAHLHEPEVLVDSQALAAATARRAQQVTQPPEAELTSRCCCCGGAPSTTAGADRAQLS